MSQKSTFAAVDYYLGCDVAKSKLDVSLINAQGIELWVDKLPNEPEAIAAYLLTVVCAYPNQTVRCVVEATSIYHLALAETSYELGVACQVYNPIITKGATKGTVRGKKTDRSDALLIARLGLRGEGRAYTPEPYMTTKHYARSCQKLSILSSSFLQYKNHIAELLGGEMNPDSLKVLADIQVAIKQARKQLYKDLAESAKGATFTRLQTIPGVGPFIASSLIGEIQAMERFPTTRSLIAYAGLDPKIRQSGKVLNSTGRLTKRGSTYLRRNAFLAANIARRYDPQFQALYDKKRAEGKPYTVAVCVVARKLLTVVRAVWLSEIDYDLNKWNNKST
jgi:transposase